MADDLSLLFKLRAQNQASPVIHNVQADVNKLRQSVGSDFNSMQQVSTVALGKISQSITGLTSRVPVLGSTLGSLTTELSATAGVGAEAGGALAALGGPITLAIAGAAGLVVGIAAVTKALFDLGIAAADAQGKMFDLSQQTGVSVETLTALDLLAQQTGGNIESITQSLVVFQGNMEAAEEPTTKQAKAFKELNVTITDTEDTLRKTLAALAAMPEGFRQTNTAAELFGRRGGKQLLAILKESHGDIDKTIDKLRGMGLGITESARQADALNDKLKEFEFQLKGIEAELGNQVIPAILKGAEALTEFSEKNKDGLQALGIIIRGIATAVEIHLVAALKHLEVVWKAHKIVMEGVAEVYERVAAAMQLIRGTVPQITGNEIPAQSLSGLGGAESGQALLDQLDKIRKQREQAAQAGLKPFNLEEIFGIKKAGGASGVKAAVDPALQLLKQLQGELNGLKDTTRAEAIATELLDTKYKNISATIKERILSTARLIDQTRLNIETERQLAEEEEKRTRERQQAIESLNSFIEQQAEQLRAARDEFKSAQDEVTKFIASLSGIEGVLDSQQEFWLRFNAALIDSETHLKEINKQLKDVAENTPRISGEGIGETGPFTGGIFDAIPPDAEERFRGLQNALDQLGVSFGNLIGVSKDFGIQFGDVIGGAIADLSFAIGDLVNQWVLLGSTGPNAMRKLTASVLAGLAAQAAVKAIFQLAEGFAALFFNPAEAAAHFKSAALFGAVAVAAGAAGRGIAGDVFKPAAAGGGKAESGTGQLNPLTLNRNQPQTQRMIIEIRTNDSQFGKAITAHIVKDFHEAGPMREVFANDGRF